MFMAGTQNSLVYSSLSCSGHRLRRFRLFNKGNFFLSPAWSFFEVQHSGTIFCKGFARIFVSIQRAAIKQRVGRVGFYERCKLACERLWKITLQAA